MSDLIKLGTRPVPDESRDAVHVAIIPVQGAMRLMPGTPVALLNGKAVISPVDEAIGVVDPFLKGSVEEDGWFWLCLKPNTITSLKHNWTHPAFQEESNKPESPAVAKAKAWMQKFVDEINAGQYEGGHFTLQDLVEAGRKYQKSGEYFYAGQYQEQPPLEFWIHWATITGEYVSNDTSYFFRCGC